MGPDRITLEMFDKLTSLAALALTESEKEYLRAELNHQLAAVRELSEIPLEEDILPTLHGLAIPPKPSRPDVSDAFPEPGKIVAQAPESEEGMFAVPDVAHRKSEEE